MSEVLALSIKENFFYSTHEPVSVKEIIKSLRGWDTIVKQSKDVLAKLTECDIDEIELQVELLRAGSLYEDVVIKLIFGTQEKLDEFLAKWHNVLGEGALRNTIVFAVISCLLGYGLYLASSAMSPDTTSHFEANNNVIINIGAGEANLTPEGLKSVIETSVANKKALAKGALNAISPARGDENASLTIGSGSSKVTIPQETIRMAPTEVHFDDPSKSDDFEDVDIQIRALDLDNPSKGWAAVVPGLINKRVKLVLDPKLDPSILAGKMAFRGNITVTKAISKRDNEYKPVEIMLRALVD